MERRGFLLNSTAVTTPLPNALPEALNYVAKGWPVFPVPPGEKKSYKSAQFSEGRQWGATTDPEEVRRDFEHWSEANVGIVTGPKSGIFVVECDTLEGHDVDGIASLAIVVAKHGALPDTLMAESPSGSLHHYFKYPDDVRITNSVSNIAPGIDVRGDGGMVVAPPSIKPGVGSYKWLNGYAIADAPNWLVALCREEPLKNVQKRVLSQKPDAMEIAIALTLAPSDDEIVSGLATNAKVMPLVSQSIPWPETIPPWVQARGPSKLNIAVEYNQLNLTDAEKMLRHIDPWTGRKEWMDICFVLANEYGETGRDLFVSWSRGDLWAGGNNANV